jgi:uncharacterized protein HemY
MKAGDREGARAAIADALWLDSRHPEAQRLMVELK